METQIKDFESQNFKYLTDIDGVLTYNVRTKELMPLSDVIDLYIEKSNGIVSVVYKSKLRLLDSCSTKLVFANVGKIRIRICENVYYASYDYNATDVFVSKMEYDSRDFMFEDVRFCLKTNKDKSRELCIMCQNLTALTRLMQHIKIGH
jgi:hypothetical protein